MCQAADGRRVTSIPGDLIHPEVRDGTVDQGSDVRWAIHHPAWLDRSDLAALPETAPEQLLARFAAEHSAMRYERASVTAAALVDVIPRHPIGYYNLACALARLRRLDEAHAALVSAIQMGWDDPVHLRFDPDLAPLRRRASFAALVEAVEARRHARRLVPGPLQSLDPVSVVSRVALDISDMVPSPEAPGVAVAVFAGERLLVSMSAGFADPAARISMDPACRFPLSMPTLWLVHMSPERGHGRMVDGLVDQHLRAALQRADALDSDMVRLTGRRHLAGRAHTESPEDLHVWAEAIPDAAVAHVVAREFIRHSGIQFGDWIRDVAGRIQCSETSVVEAAHATRDVIAIGHSRLGTPLRCSAVSGAAVLTTAEDFGRMLCAFLSAAGPGHAAIRTPQLPTGARLIRTLHGHCLQFMQTDHGHTVLARFYLDTENEPGPVDAVTSRAVGDRAEVSWQPARGVVILINSEAGAAIAARLAQAAIGG